MASLDFFTTLNEKQQAAVIHPLGQPAMVIAGAGSGKTRVLTSRVSWLIADQDVRADEIMLVTFTNKAAAEMTGRVQQMTQRTLPYSGTFHRLCARILRQSGMAIGVSPNFTIYDEDDTQSLMTELMKEVGLSPKEFKPSLLLSMISGAKNELIGPEEYADVARGKHQEAAARMYKRYQKALAANDALDFDDILVRVIDLFSENERILQRYQEQFSHVLIDEYQDTNTAQLALTKLLLQPQRNLFVVGDFSQAIYGWRGADYRNMLSLSQSLPDLVTYELDQNYRSTQSILDAATAVISQNTTHPVLSLWTEAPGGDKITVYEAPSDRDEVSYVIENVQRALNLGHEQVAILYRTNAQSRQFEEGLLQAGIAYRLVGGVRFYARKEIKDIICFLRLYVSMTDTVALTRVGKLGKRKLALYLQWLEEEKLRQASQDEELVAGESEQETESPDHVSVVLQTIDRILESTGYVQQFDPHDEEDVARLENIQELRSVAASFSDIPSFLETVALVEQESLRQQSEEEPHVTLMSIHAAKGLEFSVVFLVGMEEGMFPHSRSLMDPQQMEEERRLCYVAITRAKEKLHISYARKRLIYGRISGGIVSRFISEIPASVIDRKGVLQQAFSSLTHTFKPPVKKQQGVRFVPFDDPSIDDFLEGSLDVESFLGKGR